MAPYLSLFSVFLVTFLLAYSPAILARDLPLDITFVQEPEENYFIVKKKPAVIVCQARNAADIIFTCDGVQIPPTSVERDDLDTDPDVVSVSIKVSRSDITNRRSKKKPYWCECSALDVNDAVAITSRRSFISLSYLQGSFIEHPADTEAIAGDNVELNCQPPKGVPASKIIWRKDGRRLKVNEDGSRFIVTSESNLVIERVEAEDAGEYECVAKNMAGRRTSNKARLTVTVYAEAAEAAEEQTVDGSRGRSPRQSSRRVEKPKFFILPEENYYVNEGSSLQMTCSVQGADTLTIRCNGNRIEKDWMKATQGMDREGKRKIIQGQMELPYDQIDLLFRQGGTRNFTCSCVAWFRDSNHPRGWDSVTTDPNLGNVIQAFLDRAFLRMPEPELYAGVNSDVTLNCQPPKGEPAPWIHWFKDGRQLDLREENSRYELVQGGSLLIRSVEYRDSGQYHCVAENFVDQVESARGSLIVSAEPPSTTPAPKVMVDPRDRYKTLPDVVPTAVQFHVDLDNENFLGPDNTATLSCSLFNIDTLMFVCNGRRLSKEVVKSGEVGSLKYARITVTEDDVKALRGRDYYCQCQGWYLVDGKWKDIQGNRGMVKAQKAFLESTFLAQPSDTVVYYGDSTELECIPPAGQPEPKVYWEKDGSPIEVDGDANLEIIEGSLSFSFARVEDEGEYVCVAQNPAGEQRSVSATISVSGKPTTGPEVVDGDGTATPEVDYGITDYDGFMDEPFFVQEPRSAMVDDSSPHRIVCAVVEANNLWFECNGQDIEYTKTSTLTLKDSETGYDVLNNTLDITFDQLKDWEDQGNREYECLCKAQYKVKDTNRFDIKTSTSGIYTRLYLEDDFISAPVDTKVEEGGSVTLPCDPPRGSPTPEVAWIKDGAYIVYDSRVNLYGTNLVISNFGPADEGRYTCAASNSKTTKTTNTVTVEIGVPDVPEPEEGVDEGSDGGPVVEPEPTTDYGTDTGVVSAKVTDPYFAKDLMSVAYATKQNPAQLMCEARNVNSISFICNGYEIPTSNTASNIEVTDENGNPAYVDVVIAEMEVSRMDIRSNKGSYQCYCEGSYRTASGERDTITSQTALIEFAYMKKNFQMLPPENIEGMAGKLLTIPCKPPMAHPPPAIRWEKDGQAIANSLVMDGSLVLPSPAVEDSGMYVCFASNIAGEKNSTAAMVTIEANPDMVNVPEVTGEGGVSEGDGMGPGSQPSAQDVENCKSRVNECTFMLPQTQNPSEEDCNQAPGFLKCIAMVEEDCRDSLHQETFNSLKTALAMKCDNVDISVPAVEPSGGEEGYGGDDGECVGFSDKEISLDFICSDLNQFLSCKTIQMTESNIFGTPEGVLLADPTAVQGWLTNYCDKFFSEESRPFQDCEDQMILEKCNVDIQASDNSTFWCKTLYRAYSCADKASKMCGLEELGQDFSQLITSAQMIQCGEDSLQDEAPLPEVVEEEGPEDPETSGSKSTQEGEDGNAADGVKPLTLLATLLPMLLACLLAQR